MVTTNLRLFACLLVCVLVGITSIIFKIDITISAITLALLIATDAWVLTHAAIYNLNNTVRYIQDKEKNGHTTDIRR